MHSSLRGNKIMLALILYMVFGQVLFGLFLEPMDFRFTDSNVFWHFIWFGLPFLVYLGFTRQKISEVLMLNPLRPKNIILVIAITMAFLPAAHLLSFLGSLLFYPLIGEVLSDAIKRPLLVSLLSIAVLPAFSEEIIFRGVLNKEFEKISIIKRAFITGLFFGFMHMNIHQALYAAAIGFMLAYMLHYTCSFWAPVIGHFVNNGINILMGRSQAFSGHYDSLASNTLLYLPVMLGLCILMLPVFLLCFRQLKIFYEKNERRFDDAEQEKIFDLAFWLVVLVFVLFSFLLEIINKLAID